MTTLMDVTPQVKTVHGVDVPGGSTAGISYLLSRFAEFRALMTGKEFSVTVDRIIEMSPDAVGALIAVGCGYTPYMSYDPDETPEDSAAKLKEHMARQRAAEVKAATLPLQMQMDFVEAILDLTMPGGVGPFVKRWEGLAAKMEGIAPVVPGKEADTSSPQQST